MACELPKIDKKAEKSNLKVLIAEDNPLAAMLINGMLENFFDKENIVFAKNGQIAVDKFKEKSSTSPFDIILMDINMPLKDGITATAEIRQEEISLNLNKSVIICISGESDAKTKRRALIAGMNDFLHKPFSKAKLEEKIKPIIDLLTLKKTLDKKDVIAEPKVQVSVDAKTYPNTAEFFRTKELVSKQLELAVDAGDKDAVPKYSEDESVIKI